MTKEELIKEIHNHVFIHFGVDFLKKERHENKIVALDIFQNITIEVLKPYFLRLTDLYNFIGSYSNRDRCSVIASKDRIEIKLFQYPENIKYYKETISYFKKLSDATDLHEEIKVRQNRVRNEQRKINQLKKDLECI
jgi:hypothetical protein